MQLIERIRKKQIVILYGGAMGFMDFERNFNHAIMIRTFPEQNFKLHSGRSGIVAGQESEMEEVYNKLRYVE
jgi:anthranilate synthase component 1